MDDLRKYINIVEGRTAPLYHAIHPGKLRETLSLNTLKATWTHNIPGMGKQTGISLTRNKNVKYNHVVFVFDQARLVQKFKIVPVDGEHLYYKSIGTSDNVRDRSSSISTANLDGPNNLQLSEEFLIGNIPNLSNYLLEIQLVEPTHGTTDYHRDDLVKILELLQAYSSKHNNIPIVVDPNIKRRLPAIQPTTTPAMPNKYIVMDMNDPDEIKLLLLKDDAALAQFEDAIEDDEQDEWYTSTVDDSDFIMFDDWEGGPRKKLADMIFLFPLTTENRTWWAEQFDNSTPEEYVNSH